MSALPLKTSNLKRRTWLRLVSRSDPVGRGSWHEHHLYRIGNAAARETLLTATHHMAAIWTSLFRGMLANGTELRWLRDGPGVGRDARTAYSSLLGRYLAREYLCANEGVSVLVPVDVVSRRMKGTPYAIAKQPHNSRGLMADWIGLDVAGRLIIAEAKGSFDTGIRPWHGPSVPSVFRTAIDQATRTVVYSGARPLPARRWAVASRWATETNGRDPTVLAWCRDANSLSQDDYLGLAQLLLDCDLRAALRSLGHGDRLEKLTRSESFERVPGDTLLRVRDVAIPPGFAAIAGPFGFRPVRIQADIEALRPAFTDQRSPQIVIASLSTHRATMSADAHRFLGDKQTNHSPTTLAGLTVAWLASLNELIMEDD